MLGRSLFTHAVRNLHDANRRGRDTHGAPRARLDEAALVHVFGAGGTTAQVPDRQSNPINPSHRRQQMPWQYSQKTGRLTHDADPVVEHGYSGRAAGKNNPDMQDQLGLGPIPTGSYTISTPFEHSQAGAYTMRLTPDADTDTHRRTGFLIHADDPAHPGPISDGCIVVDRRVCKRIWRSLDQQLNVVA
ncbi:tlde1 domain-containing protein [Burkholderia stabilis]|uniref:tlde1 domain-containing protein n=1 Tax=Burkholderia stabilis TaxID=95485 RepID=UPI001E59DB8E|nr:tlde1 domain-containing protein [Burkholderia stabilis]